MKPIRTYAVTVSNYGDAIYSARSPQKARAQAFRAFRNVNDKLTFCQFTKMSSVRQIKDPPGVGERVRIGGEVVTVVYHPLMSPHQGSVWYMRDDSDVVMCSHRLDVEKIGEPA